MLVDTKMLVTAEHDGDDRGVCGKNLLGATLRVDRVALIAEKTFGVRGAQLSAGHVFSSRNENAVKRTIVIALTTPGEYVWITIPLNMRNMQHERFCERAEDCRCAFMHVSRKLQRKLTDDNKTSK